MISILDCNTTSRGGTNNKTRLVEELENTIHANNVSGDGAVS